MHPYWLRTMNLNQICLVLDLDDTLYKEADYVASGLTYVEDVLQQLYNIKLDDTLFNIWRNHPNIFDFVCEHHNLSAVVKDELISLYRYHTPEIHLSHDSKFFIEQYEPLLGAICILTDGRSLTQRLKLRALGIERFEAYISSEYDSCKPEKLRFELIQSKFSFCKKFIYIGDNIQKDFIAPNELGWTSICIRDSGNNIYSQNEIFHQGDLRQPQIWVNSFSDIGAILSKL